MTGAWDLSDPKRLALRYEDPYGPEPGKLGIVSGDGRQVYFSGSENASPILSIYSFGNRTITKADFPAKLRPNAIAAISDTESALVAVHCAAGDKGETAAIALVGLGETHVLTKDVPALAAGKPISIGFAPDAKWLVVGNGSRVACWRVPGSQVITSDPKLLPGNRHFVASAGPRNLVAAASEPVADRGVLVTLFDVSGAEPTILAVGDDAEGVVQLWAMR
jgi:hypothetical protein